MSQIQKTGDNYLRRLVTRVTSMSRAARLRRQLADIEQRTFELPRSYRGQLAQMIARECAAGLGGGEPAAHATDDAHDLDSCVERARSDNAQLRMRGIAGWIAIVYQETRDAADADNEALHRQLLRVIRLLRESTGQHAARAGGV